MSDVRNETGMSVEDDNADYVTFDMAGERYAFPMSRVREIIRMPALVRVPLAPPSLEGLANLRGRVLPVVSLRACCEMEPAEHDEATRVIVVDGGVPLGVVVDRVTSVISIEPVDAVPSTVGSDALIGVIKAAGGEMTNVLDVDRLVGSQFEQVVRAPASGSQALGLIERPGREETAGMTEEMTDDGRGDEEVFVVFRLGQEEYAVDVDAVQEIIRVPEVLIQVPKTYDFVAGLVDLRGTVLPVVDLRTRLGLPRGDPDERQRIVVLIINGVRTGFVVDSVTEVARVGRHVPEPAPELPAAHTGRIEAEHTGLIERVANLPDQKRMLLLVRVDRLLAAGQARALENVAEEALATV